MCVCVCEFSVHQSVYLSRIMRWWGSNLRQCIILNLGYVHPTRYIFKPPYAKLCIQETIQAKDRQGVHFFFHPSII